MKVGTFPTYDTGDNVYIANGQRQRFTDTGPTGTAPPDPAILPDLAQRRAAARPDVDRRSPSTRRGPRRRRPSGTARRSSTWIDAQHASTPQFRALRPGRDAADLRRRAARALAAVRALLHRRLGQRDEPRHLRAQLQHPRRRPDVPLRRRLAADRASGSRTQLGRARGARARRCAGSCRPRRGVDVHSDRSTSTAKQVIVAIPPTLAGRIDYEPALPAERDQLTAALPQGTLTKVAGVYDTAVLARRRAHRARRSTTTARQRDVRRLAGGRQPGRALRVRRRRRGARASRALVRRASAAPRCSTSFVDVLRRRGGAARRDYFETDWTRGDLDPRLPGRRSPGPGTLLAYGDGAARSRSAASTGPAPRPRLLERLHGRRRALGRARRRRGARPPLTRPGLASQSRFPR